MPKDVATYHGCAWHAIFLWELCDESAGDLGVIYNHFGSHRRERRSEKEVAAEKRCNCDFFLRKFPWQ